MPYLVENYKEQSQEIQQSIIALCVEYLDNLCNEKYKVDNYLLIELFNIDSISHKKKITLLINNIKWLDKMQVKAAFTILNMPDFVSLFLGKRPKFNMTDENRMILEELNNKGWITGYEMDKKEPGYYRAYGRRI